MFFSTTIPRIQAILVPNEMLIIWLYKVCCPKFLTTVLCHPQHLEYTAQTLMLSVHLAVNPKVQGSKHAVNIFLCYKLFFVDDHMWEHPRCDCMGHDLNLHEGQAHILVCYKRLYVIQGVKISEWLSVCQLQKGYSHVSMVTW